MSAYTRLSCLFWSWEPMTLLDPTTIKLWLVLYTQKEHPPGLWKGDVLTMASEARLPPDETLRSLDRLLAHELVQYDHNARVLRMTRLPDAGEWPSSPYILKAWWGRFKNIPACAVRDAHVTTLRWLLEQGASESEKNKGGVSEGHEAIWCETFGKIVIPTVVPRFMDNRYDTGTAVQPSLFAAPSPTPSPIQTIPSQPLPTSSSASPNHLETLIRVGLRSPTTSGTGEGEGEGEGVFSGSEDPESTASAKPHLTLVPMPTTPQPSTVTPFEPTALVHVLQAAFGRHHLFRCTPEQENALRELVVTLSESGIGDPDTPVLAEWLATGGMRLTQVTASAYTQIAWWLADDNLGRSVRTARAWRDEAEERRRDLAQARDQAGV